MRTFICIALAFVALWAVTEAAAVDVAQLLDVDAGVAAEPEQAAVRPVRQFGYGGFPGGYGGGFGGPGFGGGYGRPGFGGGYGGGFGRPGFGYGGGFGRPGFGGGYGGYPGFGGFYG